MTLKDAVYAYMEAVKSYIEGSAWVAFFQGDMYQCVHGDISEQARKLNEADEALREALNAD